MYSEDMWKKLSSKVVFEHPRLLVEEDEVELESGEKTQYLKYGYGGDGVVIVARNNSDEILFIREYSYVPNRTMLQLPMGKIEGDEALDIAANRELQEETDLKASKVTEAGSYFQNHRRSTNMGRVVAASDLLTSTLQGDIEEAGIEIAWVPVSEITSHILNGEIADADTLSSLRICGV